METEGQRDKDINERVRKMDLRIVKDIVGSDPQERQEEDDPTEYKDITKVNEQAKEQAKAKSKRKALGKKTKTQVVRTAVKLGEKDGKN